jgi:hypothetical protein
MAKTSTERTQEYRARLKIVRDTERAKAIADGTLVVPVVLRDSKGKIVCEHNKKPSQCRECHGSSFCQHGNQRSYCKECGGASICKHNKRRHSCKKCGGASIREHKRNRQYCRECNGSVFCEHGRMKRICKLCKGSGLCEHLKSKEVCADCNILGAFDRYKRGAEKRGLEFSVTLEDYFWYSLSACQYCGNHETVSGMDRVDSSLGYTLENVVPCCTMCNMMKWANPEKGFLTHVERIHAHSVKIGRI